MYLFNMLLLFICIYLTFYQSYDPNSSAGIDDPTGGFIYLFIHLFIQQDYFTNTVYI